MGPDGKYWHSWICFNIGNEKFVFDPCLRILVERSIYHHIFEVEVEGTVTAKQVREDLIFRIKNKKVESVDEEKSSVLWDSLGSSADISCLNVVRRQRKETFILGDDDVNAPMYRNSTGYIANIKNGKIKKMIAYFYINA